MRTLLALPLLVACNPRVACLVVEAAPTSEECGLEDGCCSFSWETCEDGVDYAVTCDSRTLPTSCACFEDGQLTETFQPESYTCPPNFEQPRIETILPLANEGCGWNIQP